ncbi:hypothetical protein POSPLADRAFT_1051539 [Postia placenta MAD-698-R-SB12]|uniref:CCHC-type domain-containing protein n=1 Tax=Postia placenta MAD-698-R-SB12 TaxID=670580 RepID=A0A1X6NG56_9APHY|nr:hypothetical protein POSPLADRAFT_1051539 [Postia placenta MAD-698-R-SB12]OSX67396.1 hypothetical protein POSPLADRAFT_1051539 [Postia placenta MAD-698-R-SB12]
MYGGTSHPAFSVHAPSYMAAPGLSSNISSTITSNNTVNPVPLGLPALAGSPLLQYDRADRCFVTSTKRAPIYPRGGTWCHATGPNPQVVAHQELINYYQRHPPAHPEDVFTILWIDVEPTQTAESVQSPINEQPLELPEVQYVPIEIPDIELPPAPPAPTNAPVEVPMATFTQEDIDQRIAIALAAYQSQQSTANRPLRLDIPAPEPFSGKAEDLRRFIQCVLSYFVATNNTQLSDEAKIAFTVALMRKDLGKTWADAYYKKSAGGVQVYSTWANFVATLEEVFPEHGTRIKAHQILMKLPERQRDRKTALSLGNYVTRFEQLASKAQLKDAEVNGTNRVENDYHTLHANFVKGLPKELYFALATRVARDRPNTMKAWYDEVRNANAAKQGALVVTDTRDYGEPMDIDAAAVASTFASTSGGRKWELGAVLNEADRKLHRDGNLCFYCHIKGHSAKDCRKKAAARQGGGRPNQGGSGKDDFRARIKTLSADEKRELYEELTMEDF